MGYSKKTAKGRLDKYYHLAKEQGYRARSAFKLVQLNKKYEFLQNSRVVIDLCAAPGGWCQVAAKFMPKSKIIIGVDLAPIKPITGVITMVNDITTEKCRTDIKRELKDWKADVVLHDGAPNVGNSWIQDAFTQSELVLSSLKLATEFLIEGGWFVTKVFRSKDYNSLMWVFNQLFKKVEATKPSSSRDVSAEIFVVCKGYLAPKTIDPRFLDPRSVFTDVESLVNGGTATAKTNLLHPDKKKRHREGYEDGANILFKKLDVIEYINSDKFADLLAESNCISFDSSDETVKTILNDFETTEEIKTCCEDLKVLGRREFKLLLKWRLKMRKLLGLDSEEKTTVEETKTEENPEDDIEALNDSLQKKAKREKRKALERKAKMRIRLNMQMENANDLADGLADESLFSLKKVKSSAPCSSYEEPEMSESEQESGSEVDYESEDENSQDSEDDHYNRMEQELEENHQENLTKISTKKAAKKSKSHDSSDEDMSDDLEQEAGLEELPSKPLLVDMRKNEDIKAINSAKVSMWYSNPLFQSMSKISADIMKHQEEKKTKKKNRQYQESPVESLKAEAELESGKVPTETKKPTENKQKSKQSKEEESTAGSITFVKAEDKFDHCFDEEDAKLALNTEEGMAMATKLASGNRNKMREELIDESFNRFAFSEKMTDLPSWFADDESKHNKPIKPITREVADAIKSKLKEINDLPIKKILEAKGRNKTRSLRRLEGLKKKAEAIMGSGEEGEKAKLIQISKMLKKSSIKREKPSLIVATGLNRGLKGRPKGVKGRYKMVDRRMMKELRAEKRIKKRASKK